MRSNLWELQEAQRALRAGDLRLLGRYLEKALECVQCMYCHGHLDSQRPYRPHFKGFVHEDCGDKYGGRLDYLRQHPEEDV